MQKHKFLPAALLAACFGVAAFGAHGAERVFKWVDENGVVHFGQQPPAAIKSEAIKVQKGFSTADPDAPVELSDEQKKQAADAETCKVATQNFDMLSTNDEVKRTDEYGEAHVMTKEEMEAEKQKAKAAMDRYCNSAASEEPAKAP